MIKKYDDVDFEALETMVKAILTMLIDKGIVNMNSFQNAVDEHLQLQFQEKNRRKLKDTKHDLK